MTILKDNPYANAYTYYGAPERMVDFRVFSLNNCEMGCKGCFYEKVGNDYSDFKKMRALAEVFRDKDYILESFYLLPTEIFEDKDNYRLFEDNDFTSTISMFNFLGLAATLEKELDHGFIKKVTSELKVKVEIQINLLVKRIFDEDYLDHLERVILETKAIHGDTVSMNLAINTGFVLSPIESDKVFRLVENLSEDKVLETNFTFMFNDKIAHEKRRSMLKEAFKQVRAVQDFYSDFDDFTERFTPLRLEEKVAIAFVSNDQAYVTPIFPFDEHVFIKDERYRLAEPTFESFIDTIAKIDETNEVVGEECYSCPTFATCHGKRYFPIAHHFNLGCQVNKESGD